MGSGWKKDYARYRGYFLNVLAVTQKRQDIKTFLEILLTLSTIIIFIVFALKPTLVTISELIKEIDSKQEVINQMDTKLNNLKQAQTVVTTEADRIALLDSAVPVRPDPDKFSIQIEGTSSLDLAQLLGLTIDELTLMGIGKTTKSSQDTKSLPQGALGMSFAINNSGAYFDLQNLINHLEQMRRPIQFESLNLSTIITELTEGLTLSVSGQVPYVQEGSTESEDTTK